MTTYSTSLKLALIGDGQEVGVWGQTTNTNLGTLLEQAIAGLVSINMGDTNVTLTSLNGASDQARNQVLVLTGTNSAVRDVIPPVVEKTYIVVNNTTGGYAVRVIGSSGTGVNVPNGTASLIYCNGTSFFEAINSNTITGNASVSGALAVTGAISGSTATFSGAISSVSPAFTGTPTSTTATPGTNTTQIATTAFVTGAVSTVTGSLGTMSTQNANNVSITGGTITGITDLTVADGGTGASTFTSNSVVLGNGTSALNGNMVAPGASGNVLTSNGTTWQSAAGPASIGVGQSYVDYVAAGGRSTNTVYQNTTGKPIMVNIAGTGSTGIAYCDTSNPPTTQCAYAPAGGGAVFASMSFIVPNNFYYRVTGGLSYYCWSELR